MWCSQPIVIYHRGDEPAINPATGIPEWREVACGQCPTCQAGRKNDWTGRLVAEAYESAAVYFVTLTYKNEPNDFEYSHIQAMLKHLRKHVERHDPENTVRFFCVGEYGNKRGRRHWHLLLFFEMPFHLERTKTNQLWQFWPHGWASIDRVPRTDTIRRVRYTAKYAVKTIGDKRSCRFRCSLKPAIGAKYLSGFAQLCAESGLPLNGWFYIPGMQWDRGKRKGQQVRFRLKGASARNVCREYCQTWQKVRPQKPWHQTSFLGHYGRWWENQPIRMQDGTVTTDRFLVQAWQLRLELWPHLQSKMDWKPKREARIKIKGPEDVQHQTPDYPEAAAIASECRFWPAFQDGAEARRRDCEYAGLDAQQDGVRYYIATARVPAWTDEQTEETLWQLFYTDRRLADAGPPVDLEKSSDALAADRQPPGDHARRALARAGFQAVETIDAETGEVTFSAERAGRGGGTIGKRAPFYAPRKNGLAQRAHAQNPVPERKAER